MNIHPPPPISALATTLIVSFALLVLMVALYTISLFMHLFCNGHASLFLQLQLSALATFTEIVTMTSIYTLIHISSKFQADLTYSVLVLKDRVFISLVSSLMETKYSGKTRRLCRLFTLIIVCLSLKRHALSETRSIIMLHILFRENLAKNGLLTQISHQKLR